MNQEDREKRVVIKVSMPSSLKFQFKVRCTQKNLTMSKVLEESIKKWIQADAPTNDFILEPVKEEDEDLKGYISKCLKTRFKIFCIQKGITMRSALYNLIERWIETEAC